jgi:alcohol dehydrogenase, propanol-preferring
MKAMVLHRPSAAGPVPLALEDRPVPRPRSDEILVRVEVCGVCRTDLHVVRGDLAPLLENVVPGHEVVGRVEEVGAGVPTGLRGTRVGVPWLHSTCGSCEYCITGRENLCERKEFTGYSTDGGYAQYVTAKGAFSFPLPAGDGASLAPFLCAGIIGYRAFRAAQPRPGGRIGFFGFGGSAHLTVQLATKLGFETVVVSRNPRHAALARELGASTVVEGSGASGPGGIPRLDGAVVFAPAGEVALEALRATKKGATVAVAGIHLTPLPSIDYDALLFGERRLMSVESNTRADAQEFLALAGRLRLRSVVQVRPLAEANAALVELEAGRVDGAAVLDCS